MKDQLLAALATLASDAPDDQKQEAKAKLAEFLEGIDGDKEKKADKADDDEKEEAKAEKADDDSTPPPPPPPRDEEKKEAAEPPAKAATKDEEKTEAKAVGHAAAMAAELMNAKRRIEALEVQRLLDARADLPVSVRNWALSQSADVVRTFLSAAPRVAAKRETQPTTGAVTTSVGLQGAELEELNRLMGIRPVEAKGPQRLPDGRLVLHTMKPSEYRAMRAAAAAKGGQ